MPTKCSFRTPRSCRDFPWPRGEFGVYRECDGGCSRGWGVAVGRALATFMCLSAVAAVRAAHEPCIALVPFGPTVILRVVLASCSGRCICALLRHSKSLFFLLGTWKRDCTECEPEGWSIIQPCPDAILVAIHRTSNPWMLTTHTLTCPGYQPEIHRNDSENKAHYMINISPGAIYGCPTG